MTDADARRLFGLLMAAFPRIIEQATVDLYLGRLRGWELEPAEQAVAALVDNGRSWPAIADLRDVYFRCAARADAYQRQDEPESERVPPPPEILEQIARIGRSIDEPDPPQLQPADAGECPDCGRNGERFLVGRRAFCRADATARLEVADKVARSEP